MLCPPEVGSSIRLDSITSPQQALQLIASHGSSELGFLQFFNLHRSQPAISQLVRDPQLAGTAAQLLGARRVRLYQVRVCCCCVLLFFVLLCVVFFFALLCVVFLFCRCPCLPLQPAAAVLASRCHLLLPLPRPLVAPPPQDCVFLKEPGYAETNWHSDLRMAPLDTNAFVTAWIPLRPVQGDEGDSG